MIVNAFEICLCQKIIEGLVFASPVEMCHQLAYKTINICLHAVLNIFVCHKYIKFIIVCEQCKVQTIFTGFVRDRTRYICDNNLAFASEHNAVTAKLLKYNFLRTAAKLP